MECFKVHADEIEGRIDPYYYRLEFREWEEKLKTLKIVSFGQIIDSITNGFDYRKFQDEGIVYLRVSNIKPFNFDLTKVKKVDLNLDSISKNIKLKNGDILLTRKGTFGVALSIKEDHNYIISSEIFKIDLKDNVNSEYIEIILNSVICQKQFDKSKIGAIMGSLSQEVVKNIKIPLPSLKVQNWIVELINNAYELKKQKETEAHQLLNSINDYVLGELGIKLPELKDKITYVVYADDVKGKRLDAYYYQPKFKDIEEVIDGGKYKHDKLNNILEKLISGQRPKGGVRQIKNGIPSLGGEHVLENGSIDMENIKYIPEEFHKNHLRSSLNKNDLLVVKDGATTGKIGIIPEDYHFDEVNINEHLFLLRCKDAINPYFLFSFLKSRVGQIQFNREITGGTIMGIVRESVERIKVSLPPIPIQNKIAEEAKQRILRAKQLQEEAKKVLEEAKGKVEKIILETREI